LQDINNITAIGVDTSSEAVLECNKKGLLAFHGTIEELIANRPGEQYQFVCSFHCLEHVADPLGLMLQMKSVLHPTGKIFISTPYSPMTFERAWFDPMNHPPHHMTRWNAKSYKILSEKLEMNVSLQCSSATSVKERWKEAFSYAKEGVGAKVAGKELKKILWQHPFEALREWRFQTGRDMVNGAVAGNAVLAVFSF